MFCVFDILTILIFVYLFVLLTILTKIYICLFPIFVFWQVHPSYPVCLPFMEDICHTNMVKYITFTEDVVHPKMAFDRGCISYKYDTLWGFNGGCRSHTYFNVRHLLNYLPNPNTSWNHSLSPWPWCQMKMSAFYNCPWTLTSGL